MASDSSLAIAVGSLTRSLWWQIPQSRQQPAMVPLFCHVLHAVSVAHWYASYLYQHCFFTIGLSNQRSWNHHKVPACLAQSHFGHRSAVRVQQAKYMDRTQSELCLTSIPQATSGCWIGCDTWDLEILVKRCLAWLETWKREKGSVPGQQSVLPQASTWQAEQSFAASHWFPLSLYFSTPTSFSYADLPGMITVAIILIIQ